MPRPAKPYLHRGWWVTNVGGTRSKLCREEDGKESAEDAFLKLRQARRDSDGRIFPDLKVEQLTTLLPRQGEDEDSPPSHPRLPAWDPRLPPPARPPARS